MRIFTAEKKFGMKNSHVTKERATGNEHRGLSECSNCGAISLRLDGGYMSCLSYGWSACG